MDLLSKASLNANPSNGNQKLTLENNLERLKKNIQATFHKPDENGFIILDIVGRETMSFNSDVTEYYVEDNTYYNDQISIRPKVYTLRGEVSELYWYEKESRQTDIGYVNQKLMPIAEFAPIRSLASQQIMDKITQVQQLVQSFDNMYSRLQKINPDMNHQQLAYAYLSTIYEGREPIEISTPWTKLKSAVITNIELVQPERTRDKTEITITFKEFRTAQIGYIPYDKSDSQGRAQENLAPEVDNGLAQGKKLTSTFAFNSKGAN